MKFIKKVIVILGVVIVIIVAGLFSVNFVYDKLFDNFSFNVDNLEENINDVIAEKKENSESSIIDNEQSFEHKSEEEEIITTNEVREIEKEISTIDKIKVVKIINSNFTIDEIKDLTSLADDGVEQDELSYIKDVIKGKISSEDVTKLKEIYEKYQ